MLKHDITQDTKTFEDLKPALLSSLKNDDFEVIIADKANELSVTKKMLYDILQMVLQYQSDQ